MRLLQSCLVLLSLSFPVRALSKQLPTLKVLCLRSAAILRAADVEELLDQATALESLHIAESAHPSKLSPQFHSSQRRRCFQVVILPTVDSSAGATFILHVSNAGTGRHLP